MWHNSRRLGLVPLVLTVATTVTAALVGCARYQFDAPNTIIDGPGNEVHGTNVEKEHDGFAVTAITRLNGTRVLHEKPNVIIDSGTAGNWQWEVRAVPSLLPSWKAWEADKKFQARAKLATDDWNHPAANWGQAFARAHEVAAYLLGRAPLPLKLTVLLVPEGSKYEGNFPSKGNGAVALTFAFFYPPEAPDTHALTTDRFAALVHAVSTSVYEYQHTLAPTGTIPAAGDDAADKTINDEARSHCWQYSTTLALGSGTHSNLAWDPAAARAALLEGSSRQNISLDTGEEPSDKNASGSDGKRRFSDAIFWGRELVSENLVSYLTARGILEPRVQSNRPPEMNAVLSFCRAMTQHPRDLTKGLIPPSDVPYVPFFPDPLSASSPRKVSQ